MSQPHQPGYPTGEGSPAPTPSWQQAHPQQLPYQPAPRPRTALWIGLGALGLVLAVTAVTFTGFVTPGFFLAGDQGRTTGSPAPLAPSSVPAQQTPQQKRPTPLPDPTTCSFPAIADEASKKTPPPPPGYIPANGTVTVTIKSTAGDIGLSLDRALAPCTVASFLSLAQQGFYDGTSCHRLSVTTLRVLQCGAPDRAGVGGPGYITPNETFPELKYGRGTLAMSLDIAPGTGGSQFFMIFGDSPLPPHYTVFGRVSDSGLQVLDTVARGGADNTRGPGDGTGPPTIPVTFQSVTVS